MVSFTAVLQILALVAAMAVAATDDETKKPEPAAAAVTEETGHGEQLRTTTPAESKDVSILKQINRVNDDGSYTFGYEASDGSFKVETRDVAGNVKGMFGFVDEAGRLKRVSYSASNSSGFRATAGSAPPPGADESSAEQPRPVPPQTQTYKDDDDEDGVGKSASAVKKVLVSKRPVTAARTEDLQSDGRRGGNDPRRQLPRNDAADVYGVHDRSMGPMSPVVSALMSELEPIIASSYRPTVRETRPTPRRAAGDTSVQQYEESPSISRKAQEDEEPATPQYRQPAYRQQQTAVYPAPALRLTPVAYQPPVQVGSAYGPNLAALRDELMELILSVVQSRVSQLVSVAPYPQPPPPPPPYPVMPYQQPNYYVPSYYQGPAAQLQRFGGQRAVYEDGYVVAAGPRQPSSPRVTQTLKDGLIRMLLSTSPRYDPERVAGERAPRLTYDARQTDRPSSATPVRSVQIVGTDDGGSDSRPVTTESPD